MTELETVLIVEDNDDDFALIADALSPWTSQNNRLRRVRTGEEARDLLAEIHADQRGDHPGTPRLVMLDLSLPGIEGREVLRFIKQDQRLRIIPVIIVSGLNDQQTVRDCYERGANSFVEKPALAEAFLRSVARAREFWLETSRPAPQAPS